VCVWGGGRGGNWEAFGGEGGKWWLGMCGGLSTVRMEGEVRLDLRP